MCIRDRSWLVPHQCIFQQHSPKEIISCQKVTQSKKNHPQILWLSLEFGKIIFTLRSIFRQYIYSKTTESALKCQFSHHIAEKRMEISLTFLLLVFLNLVPFHQFYVLLSHLRAVFLQFYCNFHLQVNYCMQLVNMVL